MELNVDEFAIKFLDELKTLAKTETVIGEPFTLGAFTCVPIIKLGFGVGGGGGNGENAKSEKGVGGGAGGGVGIAPVGFLVTKGEEISVLTLDKHSGLSTLFEKVPEMMDKYFASQAAHKN